MFKKTLALALALVMMLQPLAASAVTWGELTAGLKNSTTGKYVSDDGATTIENKDGVTTITGGEINFNQNSITESGSYVFNGIKTDFFHIAGRNDNDIVVFLNDSEIIDLMAFSNDTSSLSITNNGLVEFFDFYVRDDGKITLDNQGQGSVNAYIDLYDQGTFKGEGNLEQMIAWTNDGVALTIEEAIALYNEIGLTTEKAYVSAWSEELRDAVNAFMIEDKDGYFYVYEVDPESGEEVLVGVYEKESQSAETETEHERQQRLDEEKRQAGAVGGVTTSIFWNYQMYLGHSTYNGRVYVGGEKALTKQSLNWLPDGGKNYTLRINAAEPNPADVEIRVAQDILDVCERAGITTLTLADKDGNPFAQFAVADLIAARAQYGLTALELLCVSADPNAEVMKVTEGGEYLPL